MRNSHVAALSLLMTFGVCAVSAAAEGQLWTTSFADAKKAAAEKGKDIFIEFTGSDW